MPRNFGIPSREPRRPPANWWWLGLRFCEAIALIAMLVMIWAVGEFFLEAAAESIELMRMQP